MLEMDAVTTLSQEIASILNMITTLFINMSLGREQAQVNMVHKPQAWCEVCGGEDHSVAVCEKKPESFYFVGNAQRGGNYQFYRNIYNLSWQNHPNFSWGGNQNKHQKTELI